MDMRVRPCRESFATIFEASAKADHGTVLRDVLTANYTRLHRRLLRHLGCPDLASDCLHDAWLRLGETSIAAQVQSPEAYVYRIACNLAMDRLRSDKARQFADDIDTELEHLADCSPGPEAIIEARSEAFAVERALLRLPHRLRCILISLRLEKKPRQEVADRYRISLRSVDTMLRQALDHCAEACGQTVMRGVRSPIADFLGDGDPSSPRRPPRRELPYREAIIAPVENAAHALNYV